MNRSFSPSLRVQRVIETMRVLIVGGIPAGALVAGLGSRLAMFVLRVTSDDSVNGIESDDGFTIGQVTLSGTVNLMMLGATVGVIGAAAYRLVRPSLIGPRSFRLTTVALAAGAVVGSMLIHADGVDFRVLTPTWLAIALFVALPAVFACVVAIAVDRAEQANSWTRRGRARWLLPLVCVVLFPLSLVVLAVAAAVVGAYGAVTARRDERSRGSAAAHPTTTLLVRGAWLAIAVIGLVALVNDVHEVAAVT